MDTNLIEHTLHEKSHTDKSRPMYWLESSCDGLLSLEAEKLLMSLPAEHVPEKTAMWQPDIINRIAQKIVDQFSNIDIAMWLETLDVFKEQAKTSLGEHITRELNNLRQWLLNNPDEVLI